MKRIFQIMFTAVAGVSLLACGSDDKGFIPDNSGKLTLSTADLVYGAEDTAPKSVTVTSETTWTPKSDDDWVIYSKENDKLIVSVKPNTARDLRTGVITISAPGTDDKYVNVTQTNNRFYLTAAPTTLSFEYDGGSTAQTVTVTTNSVEGWEIAAGYPAWIHITKGTDSFEVTLDDNDQAAPKSYELSLSIPELISPVSIMVRQTGVPQTGGKIALSEWRVGVKYAGKTFTVTAPDGGLSAATVTANKTWVTCNVIDDNTMMVTVAANKTGGNDNINGRKATISVVSGAFTSTVDIVQNGYGQSTNGSWLAGPYTAYGTPNNTTAPNSFATTGLTGTNSVNGNQLLALQNYGTAAYRLYITIMDEVPYIDTEYSYQNNGTYRFLPLVFYYTGVTSTSISFVNLEDPYPIFWNPNPASIDFSGQYEGKELYVVLGAFDVNWAYAGLWGAAYSSLKCYNTIAAGAARMSANTAPSMTNIEEFTAIKRPANITLPESIDIRDIKFLSEVDLLESIGN